MGISIFTTKILKYSTEMFSNVLRFMSSNYKRIVSIYKRNNLGIKLGKRNK